MLPTIRNAIKAMTRRIAKTGNCTFGALARFKIDSAEVTQLAVSLAMALAFQMTPTPPAAIELSSSYPRTLCAALARDARAGTTCRADQCPLASNTSNVSKPY
jgi:hypothetical protein